VRVAASLKANFNHLVKRKSKIRHGNKEESSKVSLKCATNLPHPQVFKREYVRKISVSIFEEKRELKKHVDLLG
jgi:hypothetical protein